MSSYIEFRNLLLYVEREQLVFEEFSARRTRKYTWQRKRTVPATANIFLKKKADAACSFVAVQ